VAFNEESLDNTSTLEHTASRATIKRTHDVEEILSVA
jgi:hypothetical protein